MNTLEQICAKKRDHVALSKSKLSLDDLKYKISDAPRPAGFLCALMEKPGPALIAEVKKASPSKGVIRGDFKPAEIAKIYEESGATCLSVLTDTPYFQGSDDDFTAVKAAVKLPVLRKDFMVDAYQIYESRALGADCILLIMAALRDADVKEFYNIAVNLGMDVLVEVHDRAELDRAIKLDPMMIGVNNRNLKTLAVDLQTCRDLAPLIPVTAYKVAESGIAGAEIIQSLCDDGYKGFLVGESLMREEDIGAATRALLQIK